MTRTRALLLALAVVAAALPTLPVATPALGVTAHAPPRGQDGRIAFVRANQIYTMGPAGKAVQRLTSAGRNYRPEWSPDGRRISYIHEAGGRRDVWVMNAGGRHKRAVTTTGAVTSAGAAWSPDGRTLAFASTIEDSEGFTSDLLQLVSATDPSPTPTVASGYATGGWCGEGPEVPVESFRVDDYLAWSPVARRSRIAVKTDDCYFDYALAMYHPATGEFAQHRGLGADCCGYAEWSDLFFGPTGEFGYTERDLGQYGDERGPRLILYPGFASRRGDTGGAPSPSGRFMAFTNNSSGTAHVIRSDADGTDRRRLAVGYQPDWSRKP